jgi:hypothetical protein
MQIRERAQPGRERFRIVIACAEKPTIAMRRRVIGVPHAFHFGSRDGTLPNEN